MSEKVRGMKKCKELLTANMAVRLQTLMDSLRDTVTHPYTVSTNEELLPNVDEAVVIIFKGMKDFYARNADNPEFKEMPVRHFSLRTLDGQRSTIAKEHDDGSGKMWVNPALELVFERMKDTSEILDKIHAKEITKDEVKVLRKELHVRRLI